MARREVRGRGPTRPKSGALGAKGEEIQKQKAHPKLAHAGLAPVGNPGGSSGAGGPFLRLEVSVSFWDTYDTRPVDVHPGHEAIAQSARGKSGSGPSAEQRASTEESMARCSQNDLSGVCDWCGIASDDVLLGVCADCV